MKEKILGYLYNMLYYGSFDILYQTNYGILYKYLDLLKFPLFSRIFCKTMNTFVNQTYKYIKFFFDI